MFDCDATHTHVRVEVRDKDALKTQVRNNTPFFCDTCFFELTVITLKKIIIYDVIQFLGEALLPMNWLAAQTSVASEPHWFTLEARADKPDKPAEVNICSVVLFVVVCLTCVFSFLWRCFVICWSLVA